METNKLDYVNKLTDNEKSDHINGIGAEIAVDIATIMENEFMTFSKIETKK